MAEQLPPTGPPNWDGLAYFAVVSVITLAVEWLRRLMPPPRTTPYKTREERRQARERKMQELEADPDEFDPDPRDIDAEDGYDDDDSWNLDDDSQDDHPKPRH